MTKTNDKHFPHWYRIVINKDDSRDKIRTMCVQSRQEIKVDDDIRVQGTIYHVMEKYEIDNEDHLEVNLVEGITCYPFDDPDYDKAVRK